MIAWYDSPMYLKHDTGQHHPERPQRLRAIAAAFEESQLTARLQRIEPTPAAVDRITRVHTPDHVHRIEQACAGEAAGHLDPDTPVSADSYRAALLAAGAAIDACDRVMTGEARRAFCGVRPPGHHAECDRAMGFCLFNNIAVAAQHLVDHHRLQRVAIVDFDVHHGNGTQHIFEERSDVLFISIHEHPLYLYPGTGFAEETGKGAGIGYTLNVPMMPHTGDAEYRKAFEQKILPRLDAFKPQMLLVSAGFDAAKEDPLGHIELTDACFGWMTQRLVEMSDRHCGGKLVSLLEGGYDLAALGRGAVAHVKAMLP